jgi:CxxC-x17-CxxC domain-containing protein
MNELYSTLDNDVAYEIIDICNSYITAYDDFINASRKKEIRNTLVILLERHERLVNRIGFYSPVTARFNEIISYYLGYKEKKYLPMIIAAFHSAVNTRPNRIIKKMKDTIPSSGVTIQELQQSWYNSYINKKQRGIPPMEDKTLKCKECGDDFIYTMGEQVYYQERGFMNHPQRCKTCRDNRKNAARGPREFFSATCYGCGGEAKIPFEPKTDRPVYCSDCFAKPLTGMESSTDILSAFQGSVALQKGNATTTPLATRTANTPANTIHQQSRPNPPSNPSMMLCPNPSCRKDIFKQAPQCPHCKCDPATYLIKKNICPVCNSRTSTHNSTGPREVTSKWNYHDPTGFGMHASSTQWQKLKFIVYTCSSCGWTTKIEDGYEYGYTDWQA